jgi:hypothetical protein
LFTHYIGTLCGTTQRPLLSIPQGVIDSGSYPESGNFRLGKGGGFEESWRSLELVEFFDLDAVVEYASRVGSALTAARVGFFLEQHRDALMVEENHLDVLRQRAPAQAAYFDPARTPGRLVAGWNLVVPEEILKRSWQEVG